MRCVQTGDLSKRVFGPEDGRHHVLRPIATLGTAEGCIGLSMICDRESGLCIATSAWSTENAMTSSEQAMQPLRQRGGEILGAQPSVDQWEIAVLHRHAMSGEGACVRCT